MCEFQPFILDVDSFRPADLRKLKISGGGFLDSQVLPSGASIPKIRLHRFGIDENWKVSLFGYAMKEALSLTIRDVIVPESYDNISERIQARLKGKFMRFDRQVYRAIRKDGSTFRAEVSTSMVTFQDQTAIQGVLRDITEQEHLQEQIEKAERMQAIGTLAGGIAHDFNNLLMGIQGRTSLILMDTAESHQNHEQLKGIEIYRGNQNEIALVIPDMVMPGMNGHETYDRFKEINPEITVLLSSGYSIDSAARDILKGSSGGFIQKPFNVKILSGKIKQLLE